MKQPSMNRGAIRWGLVLALVALATLIFVWSGPKEGEPPGLPAPHGSAPAPAPEETSRPGGQSKAPSSLELSRGSEPVVHADSLAPGEPFRVKLLLSSDAGKIGVESIWVYGEGHEPTRIEGERATPSEMRVALPPELLTPGRHIVELRTDEFTHIPLRRFSFEIR